MGVALGVMALMVVTSVINGFEGELVRVITRVNGDVMLYSRGEPMRDADQVEEELRQGLPQVVALTRSFVAELMVAGPNGVAGAILQGVEVEHLGEVTEIPQSLSEGVLPAASDEVALGFHLAQKLGLRVGEQVRLIAPFTGKADGAPQVLLAKVVGLVKMGMFEYDSKFIFMTLEAVQGFLEQKGRVTHFNLKLAKGTNARLASDRLGQMFDYPMKSKDWSQLNRNLFYAIQVEKAVIALILTVIILVASFNVVGTLMMMIHDKTKEIGILKAMGLRPEQGFWLFCMIGVGLGGVGTFLGLLGGGLALWGIARLNLIQLPADIYYITFLPVGVRSSEVILIVLVTLLIAAAATVYPALKVARQSPLEGLRHE